MRAIADESSCEMHLLAEHWNVFPVEQDSVVGPLELLEHLAEDVLDVRPGDL